MKYKVSNTYEKRFRVVETIRSSVNDDALSRLNSLLIDNATVPEAEKVSENSVFGLSSRHLQELSELHQWISEDEELASPEIPLSPIESTSNALESYTAVPRDTKGFAPVLSPLAEHAEEEASGTVTPLKSNFASQIDDSKEKLMLEALIEENKLLKKEISAFDMEFFEQLEDLKYRYVRMQEMVGADPIHHHKEEESIDVPSLEKLPLDRLAWSTKNYSTKALDRAKYTSPLVSGPVANRLTSNTHHTSAPTYHAKDYLTQSKRGII